jgi:U4/U6 small nuclear ribonucleoprotein PRP3
MGDQAFVDPSQMEKKVTEQMQARQHAHLSKNEANRLTKEQRSAKRARKLEEDTSQAVTVALFWVKDMSHPYHRTKVELNARQNNITGGVLECENPNMACVICEGGPKAIKRYTRLMLVRMKWTGTDDDVEEEGDGGEEEKDKDGEPKIHKVCVRGWLRVFFIPTL